MVLGDDFGLGGLFARRRKPRADKGRPRGSSKARGLREGKYLINPAFLADPRNKEKMLAALRAPIGVRPLEHLDEAQIYFPEDFDKRLPEEGGWIRLTRPPTNCQVMVEPLSMWFAVPFMMPNSHHRKFGYPRWQAVINTPDGPLHLWPYEYVTVTNIEEFVGMEEQGIYINYMSEDAAVPVDRLHYIMSRGISRRQAYLLCLADLHDQNFCYFTTHEAYWPLFLRPEECPRAFLERYAAGAANNRRPEAFAKIPKVTMHVRRLAADGALIGEETVVV